MSQNMTSKQKEVLSKIKELSNDGKEPTLEELRKALSFKYISSVQRHTEALKSKGYLNEGARGLSLFQPRSVNTIFTIQNQQLGMLDSGQSVMFFRDLLWAESRQLGLPVNKVSISLWTNVPDGGIDASVENYLSAKIKSSGLIKTNLTSYQIKTGSTFKPWRLSEIKKEVFDSKNKTTKKKELGGSIKKCLDEHGNYILVCFGLEFTDEQLQKAEENLKSVFEKCGYKNPKVEVWGQSTIIGFTKQFPSLVLQLQGFEQSHFQTQKSWTLQDDMQQKMELGKLQETFISELRDLLRENDIAKHIRVWAEPGAGKTRLVLEAISAEDLSPLVVYCDSPDKFRDSNLMNELLKEDNHFAVILVIDECNSDSRSYIWNKLKNLGGRIKLITIYNEYDDTSGSIIYLDAPALGKEEISNIIQSYGVVKDQADRWADLCSGSTQVYDGSPRVAHMIGWNLKNNPEDVLKPLDTVNIWDRYIISGDDASSIEVQQRKIVLEHIALFKMFGFGKPVINESQSIAKLVGEVDPQITFPRFQQIIKKLRERKIIQGETTLYITPKALHIQLWKDWWNTYGDAFDFEEFSSKIPDSLREWFYEMFRYAAESTAASAIVEELLGSNGPFYKNDYLKSKLGADFFLVLTEANAKAALNCLQDTVGSWSKQELLDYKEPRQKLVWALERMAVWRPLFIDAAKLLLSLAEAENETIYRNNASGTFTGLFSPGPGSVAPTEASPLERYPILEEAINSESKERRILAIEACDKALEANHFARVSSAEYQGFREAKLWRPKNRKEMMDAYLRVWSLLYSKIESLPDDEKKKIIEVLLNNSRSLTPAEELAEVIIPNIATLSTKPYAEKKEILETVESILHYGKKELAPKIFDEWKSLRDDLVGNDFPSLMKRYVGMDLLEDRYDENGKRGTDKADKHMDSLAQMIIDKPSLIESELHWLVTDDAKNGYKFAYKLGNIDNKFLLLPKILDAQKAAVEDEKVSDFFIGGYLRALNERDNAKWESLMEDLSSDTKLASWVAGFTWRSGVSDKAALRVLRLAEAGVLKPYHLRIFGLGSVIKDLSDDVLNLWIKYLLKSKEDYAVSIALDLYHFFYIRKDAKYKLPEKLTLRLLTHKSLFTPIAEGKRDQMDDYHWQGIAEKFIELYPHNEIFLVEIALEHFGEGGTILEGYRSHVISVINKIARKHPVEVWNQVKRYLGPPIDRRAYQIKSWLRGESFFEEQEGTLSDFSPKLVWDWVDEEIEERARYLASFVPKVLHRQTGRTCWARELLVRYGDREDVQNSLIANFSSEGWTGPASMHYQQKRDDLLSFKEHEENVYVKKWIDKFVISLNKQIEHEKVREERDGF